jgi:hypothetical protein
MCPFTDRVQRLQRLNGEHLGLYGGWGWRVSGLGQESLHESGPVLDALEPVLDDRGELVHVAGGEIAQAVFHVRPDALGGVEVGAQAGSRSPVSQSGWAWMNVRIAVLMCVFRLSRSG